MDRSTVDAMPVLKFIAMAVTFGTLPKIVRRVDGGALRVGKTRVSLDSVVYAFNRGESAEEIQRDFDTLSLADIHGAIAYYLHNKDQVDKYLAKREADYEKLRERDRARPDHLTRDLLLARKKQSKKDSE